MRGTFARSMRGHAQGETLLPWRGYLLWVGGTLLIMFLAIDGLMPRPAPNRYLGAAVKMPTIKIHSELKGPEAITLDTTGFVPPQPLSAEALEQTAVLSGAPAPQVAPPRPEPTEAINDASSHGAGMREAFAQFAPQGDGAVGKSARRNRRSLVRSGKARSRSAIASEFRF